MANLSSVIRGVAAGGVLGGAAKAVHPDMGRVTPEMIRSLQRAMDRKRRLQQARPRPLSSSDGYLGRVGEAAGRVVGTVKRAGDQLSAGFKRGVNQ